ncbi:hypothetical protein MF672_039055 [Actinomadura sp. ATCC 31491]|uniref:Phage portal protein n=1 Tax=Actinomadura luzonensis TaxID=2805427 RepID=A0ABT0G567_9ACTN|nr:hypothetical protein [Actinomadura luzonensis]MCK2219754.1 hypothetical protein [Actinomadura luzonensis]
MTELAIPNQQRGHELAVAQPSPLVQFAMEAQQAEQIANVLARSSFIPATLRGKPQEITAAILAGQELGLPPMATLRSIDIIQGTPGLRAHAMRGLVQSHGHTVQVVESSDTRCVMRGKRKGETEWQQVEWDLERATLLGLTGKSEWKRQPRTMLVARATGEICRLIAADVLYAMPYASEELDTETQYSAEVTVNGRATAADIIRRETSPPPGEAQAATAPAPAATAQLREISMLMTACGITAHTGKGSTALNEKARFEWLSDFLARPIEGTTKTLTTDEADRVLAELRARQLEIAQQRAELEKQIGRLFDGMDKPMSGADRLRDLSLLLDRTISGPADLSDQELSEVAAILADCQGQTAAWDAALQAAQEQRQQGGGE